MDFMANITHENNVREVAAALPHDTRRLGARGAGPGHLDTVLGVTPRRRAGGAGSAAQRDRLETQRVETRDQVLDCTVSPAVTEERLQHFLYNKHGLMRLGTVGVTVGAVVGLVHSLNKVPENAGPAIIRAVLFMVLPLVLRGFRGLTVCQRAAFVCLLAPGVAGLITMRETVGAMETVSLQEDLFGCTHACALHDEGERMTRNYLLVYLLFMIRGVVGTARAMGVFPAGKRGVENATPIAARAEKLGMCKTVECEKHGEVTPENSCNNGCTFYHGVQVIVSLTLMTCDAAGGKAAEGMLPLGLIFTVWCSAHCSNGCSSVYSTGYGVATRGRPHPFNLTFDIMNVMRKHVGIDVFFVILACYLNMQMLAFGGAAYIAAGSPKILGKDLQEAIDWGDIPMDQRWLSIQKVVEMLLSGAIIVKDPLVVGWLYLAGISDLTVIPMLILAFKAVGIAHYHHWYCQPSKDRATFGSSPLVVKIQAELQDPFMLAQLEWINFLYDFVLRQAFAHSRSSESGGGVRLLLKHRTITRDLIKQCADVRSLPFWEAAVGKIENELKQTIFFHSAVRVVAAMLEKTEVHWLRAALHIVLALGDLDLQQHLGNKIFGLLVGAGLAEPDPPGFNSTPALRVTYSYTCGGCVHNMDTDAATIADEVHAAIMLAGGASAVVGWDRLFKNPGPYNIREGFLLWRRCSYTFDLTNPETVKSPFFLFFNEVAMTGNQTSMVVEIAVNKMDEVTNATKGKVSAAALELRMLTEEQRCRLGRAADARTVVPAKCECSSCEKLREGRQAARLARGAAPRRAQDDSLSGDGEVRCKSKIFTQSLLIESCAFAKGKSERAAAIVESLPGRMERERAIVLEKVEVDFERNCPTTTVLEKKEKKAAEQLVIAKAALEDALVDPRSFGLVKLTSHKRTYQHSKMVETLLVREQREAVGRGIAFDTAGRTSELEKLTVEPLRRLMVEEFYGSEFEYVKGMTYCPANGTPERQALGVKFAIENKWVQRKVVPAPVAGAQ